MKKNISLSVVLATYNEEKNIVRCLDSVKGIADEIIVVDGTSSDKTVELAKKYTSKVYVTDNPPIFHINKQKAIDKATKDWILQLDADEVVSESLANEIQRVLSQSHEHNGYWMPRKNYFLGRYLMKGGQYPDYTIRLYKNGKGKLPQKDVHEQAVIEGSVGTLTHALLHYPYADFNAYLMKWNRYTDLIAAELRVKMKKQHAFQNILLFLGYAIAKPGHWFLTTYFRHKGFMDSWQGFVFSLFSALRFPVSLFKAVFYEAPQKK